MARTHVRSAATALAVAGAAAVGAFAWGTLVERKMFTLRRVTAPVLPAGARPIRVLHLSDLHMAPWQKDKQDWIRSLADLDLDLIVDTGDNLGHVDGLPGIEYAFERFRGIPGVFVHGSNDYYGPQAKNPMKYFTGPSKMATTAALLDNAALTAYLEDLGWLDLNNSAGSLDLVGTHVEFFGVNDPHRHFDRLDLIPGALEELRENDPYSEDAMWPEDAPKHERPTLTVGVAHAPYQRVLDSFVTYGASLIFAGHTHGGQVCIPGFGALVTNCDIPRRQAKGLSIWRHAFRSAYLNVSAGLGTSIYAPFRFACPPEATFLTLIPAR
ncbi:metallophosphoesterase [Diaminobutyricibacter sp. McL0618]|uniref:metallophosphoesterase n=1 Tax=Leifsonia sp. McL0618 TaxID=3415677 RepID=UPI003CEC382E